MIRAKKLFILFMVTASAFGQTQAPATATNNSERQIATPQPARAAKPGSKVCAQCIRSHEEFLAADALNGRGSATHDELVAAIYIASQMRQYGIEPAGDKGGFLQRVPLIRRKVSAPPELHFMTPGDGLPAMDITFKHGLEVLFLRLGETEVRGHLQKIEMGAKPAAPVEKGAYVFLKAKPGGKVPGYEDAGKMLKDGAAAVLLQEDPRYHAHWKAIGERVYSDSLELADATGSNAEDKSSIIMLSEEAGKRLDEMPEGTRMWVSAAMEKPQTATSWNAVGEIRGSDPKLRAEAVLFSAHLDHLGIGAAVNGDNIYNGADDDASGTAAVLELARVLGAGRKPRRTVIFALFGSEELGGLGSTYFREHPPLPLENIAANLEFEMIGRADPAVPSDTLWLSGWERSNLGPTLAAHGAHLVGDPHPEQSFFARSDNYVLAQKGVVAQTISSYGLHKDYHQPSDDLAHLDFKHMEEAIGSLLGPVEWLVNSRFKPQWKAGGQP
jgi:aminopeptidase YwaD